MSPRFAEYLVNDFLSARTSAYTNEQRACLLWTILVNDAHRGSRGAGVLGTSLSQKLITEALERGLLSDFGKEQILGGLRALALHSTRELRDTDGNKGLFSGGPEVELFREFAFGPTLRSLLTKDSALVVQTLGHVVSNASVATNEKLSFLRSPFVSRSILTWLTQAENCIGGSERNSSLSANDATRLLWSLAEIMSCPTDTSDRGGCPMKDAAYSRHHDEIVKYDFSGGAVSKSL
ncbi:unnamed protein product, partial [Amoebophrya sp. A25]